MVTILHKYSRRTPQQKALISLASLHVQPEAQVRRFLGIKGKNISIFCLFCYLKEYPTVYFDRYL